MRESGGGDAFFEARTLRGLGRADANARIFCLHRGFLRRSTQRSHARETKAKEGRKDPACEIEKEDREGERERGREGEGEREGKRKEEMDLAECIIAALKALRTRVSRERLLCVQP